MHSIQGGWEAGGDEGRASRARPRPGGPRFVLLGPEHKAEGKDRAQQRRDRLRYGETSGELQLRLVVAFSKMCACL